MNTKESKEDADVRTVRTRGEWQTTTPRQLTATPSDAHGCASTQEITRLINQRNETDFARKASQSGGNLAVVRAPCVV